MTTKTHQEWTVFVCPIGFLRVDAQEWMAGSVCPEHTRKATDDEIRQWAKEAARNDH